MVNQAHPATPLPLVVCEPYGARLTPRACVARWRGRCGEANFWLGVGRADTVKCVDCGAGRQRAEGEGEGVPLPFCRCGCGRRVRRECNLYAELACWRRHRMTTLVDQVCTECGATYQCPQAVHHLRMFCDPCGEARRAGRNRTEENR